MQCRYCNKRMEFLHECDRGDLYKVINRLRDITNEQDKEIKKLKQKEKDAID